MVDETNHARQRAFKAGRSDSGRTQVLSGDLQPGERVITAGQYKVQDGSLVGDARPARTAQTEGAGEPGREQHGKGGL